MKLRLLICLVLAMLLCIGTGADAENLLVNPSFEIQDGKGLPVGWYTDAYIPDEGYTVFSLQQDDNAPDGGTVARINNIAMNDARYAQKVSVEPETLYCLSGWIRADVADAGRGANFSIEGIYRFSESVYDTDGEWQYIEWYGETGEDQDQVTVFARVGGYSGESMGLAFFDKLCLEQVDEVPGEAVASLWFDYPTYSYNDYDDEEDTSEEASPAWPLITVLGIAWAIIAIVLIRFLEDRKSMELKKENVAPLLAGLTAALLLRMVLAAFVEGYAVDVNCFLSWGNTMWNVGPVSFYQSTGFCDYPPAYAYILGLNAGIAALFKQILPVPGVVLERIVFRFLPSLADVTACYVLYRVVLKRKTSPRTASVLAVLMAFNPVLVINSACWGQMDSVFCLVLLLVALTAAEHQWTAALPLYMLSVLIKPQALMLGFLGLLAAIMAWITDPACRKKLLLGLGLAFAVLLIVVIPYSIRQQPDWLITQYATVLAEYPYATVNTANWWYLFGGNWSPMEYPATQLSVFGLAVLYLALGFRLMKRQEGIRCRFLEPVLAWIGAAVTFTLGLRHASWSLVGTVAMAEAFLIVLPMYIRGKNSRFLPLLGGMLFLLLYVFGIKMHERYLFPAFLLLACGFALIGDKRILWVLIPVSVTVFINEGVCLDNSIRLGSAWGHLNADTLGLADLLAVVNVLCALYGTVLCHKLCVLREEPVQLLLPCLSSGKAAKRRAARDPFGYQPDHRLHWTPRDTAVMLTVTLIYAAITFCTLGSTKAPQHPWTSSTYDEEVIVDLGQEFDDFSVLYFAQVSRYNFSVSVSNDGENWAEETWVEMDQGQCWKWKYVTQSYTDASGTVKFLSSDTQDGLQSFNGRYVRITAHQIGLTLNEMIFRDRSGRTIPANVICRNYANEESPNYSDPNALLDEQDTLEGIPNLFGWGEADREDGWTADTAQPSWWNSTYFDEIYHARTAYEHLHGTTPYETSHPPLGKVLMSIGVALFGMTPFGWRFMGALAGVLMLPAMYLLCKQLTKKTCMGLLGCLLMALDCMHFTQTRIATIDSFPVLFIILSWLFMIRFLQRNLIRETVKRILPDLALSGFFMGMGIASKWIGIYSGAGLALVFFWHCLRHFRLCAEVSSCAERSSTDPGLLQACLRGFAKRFLILCAWCVLFFVAVPAAIYLLSYIPYFAGNSQVRSLGAFIRHVLDAQTYMFNYHATPGLGMDHPFYSPWYEWPLIQRPMYYAVDGFLPNNRFGFAIFAFGNPLVWLPGLLGIAYTVWLWFREKHYVTDGSSLRWHMINSTYDNGNAIVLIGLMAQFLPWVLVPRGTYIYHYFASIPFLICGAVLMFNHLDGKNRRTVRVIMAVYLLLTAAVFAAFFPYASGLPAPCGWLDLMKNFLRIYY